MLNPVVQMIFSSNAIVSNRVMAVFFKINIIFIKETLYVIKVLL